MVADDSSAHLERRLGFPRFPIFSQPLPSSSIESGGGASIFAMEAKLKELRCAEDEVCEIMKVAEEALKELQNLPQCDEDKLNELSAKYMELIRSIYSRISLHSLTMTTLSVDDVDAIYTVKKETEIYESLVSLSAAVKDGP